MTRYGPYRRIGDPPSMPTLRQSPTYSGVLQKILN